MVRSYSLMNPITDKQRYVVGVLKDRQSRGGSKYVHEKVRVGDVLDISVPRNNFPLEERAQHSVLVAGGIGITPMLCMLNRLASLGRSAELLYFARSRRDAAFLQVLESMESGQLKVRYHFDDEVGASPDLPTLLAAYPADTHFYGCGPGPALAAMLSERGFTTAAYDPIYAPNTELLQRRYDFITCTEVVEHFHDPAAEFARFDRLLRPGGWLGVMTCFQTDDARFAAWHYRRDPTHVVFYREATFRRIAQRFGWRCEIPCKDVVLMHKPAAVHDCRPCGP